MTDTYEFSDTSPSSVTEAKALVGRVQDHIETKRDETPEEEGRKLRRLQNRILESLDDAAHVVPELLQNADDVGDGCTEATIRFCEDELVVENDGVGMSEAEIKALGEFAESTKRDLSYGRAELFSLRRDPGTRDTLPLAVIPCARPYHRLATSASDSKRSSA